MLPTRLFLTLLSSSSVQAAFPALGLAPIAIDPNPSGPSASYTPQPESEVQYALLYEKVERARYEANARFELVDALREMKKQAREVEGEAAAERLQVTLP